MKGRKNLRLCDTVPECGETDNMSTGVAMKRIKESDNISSGTFSTCNSLSDSEVIRCNRRLLSNSNSEVGKKIWEAISKLGIVSKEGKNDCIKLVEAM